jgi:NAD+ synthase (glutamine-hydrolysing)
MKIALAQQNYHIGNFEENTRKAIEGIKKAKNDGADIIMFTELSICGYPPRDFLEFEDFINKCDEAINEIKQHADTIAVIVGAPQRNTISEGKNLFNAAWFLYEKEVLATTQKTLLPTYDVFDENRYFEPAYQWNVIPFKGKKIALTVCEDIWNLGDNPLYRICPMDILMEQSPDLMLNISASPFDYDHDDDRKEIIRANVLKYKLPIFYCNAVGSQTEIVFDGGSLVINAHGRIVKELAYFEEDYLVYDCEDFARDDDNASASVMPDRQFDSEMRVFKMNDPARIMEYMIAEKNITEIHHALVLGIRDYFSKLGFTKAILGSSGGIDSAVTLALAVEAIGHENVRAVLLPSQYSTSHSVTDAELLSQRLNNPYEIIEIKGVYESLMTALKPAFNDLPFSVAEENLQSRTRGNLLMAIANKFGYILLNTSNKSELATGYGTLYGDMAGGLSVLGDVYKTQVYALARYINKNKEIIPANIIEKAPSAELRPNQKDSDSLPDYSILDKILYQYIEKRQGPKDIIAMGINEAVVNKTLKLVNTNEYKRNQFCPIIRVSCKAFGVGRRMPIVGKYLS